VRPLTVNAPFAEIEMGGDSRNLVAASILSSELATKELI
jgi:hypothetical protein